MRYFMLTIFSVTGGLTVSGIVANAYRLVARKPESRAATWIYYVVMLLAGPSVLFENATRSFRKAECSRVAYGFALSLAGYWAFMIGLIVIDASMVL